MTKSNITRCSALTNIAVTGVDPHPIVNARGGASVIRQACGRLLGSAAFNNGEKDQ